MLSSKETSTYFQIRDSLGLKGYLIIKMRSMHSAMLRLNEIYQRKPP